MIDESLKVTGDVEIIVESKDGSTVVYDVKNTVLLTFWTSLLVKSLANSIGSTYDFYITRMIFGDGGTMDGVKKFVNAGREGLFGVTRLSKPAIANLDSTIPAQAIFTSVIRFEDAVGVTLNEMALQMANGQLYSMTTFPDLSKTEDMQINFNWRINFI